MQQQNQQVSGFMAVITRISQVMAAGGAIALAAMMMISVIDVGGRYFFLAPLEGSFELVGTIMVIAATWGLAYSQLRKGHIRVTVLSERFSPRGQSMLYVLAYIICAAAAGMVTWQGFLRMYEYIFKTLGGVTDTLAIPYWPFMLAMVIGFGWVCFIFLIDLFNSLVKVFKR